MLYYFRGICFERTKQWPKAEADFKQALQLYPDEPLVLNYLGYSWVDQGVNLDEAFKMLRRAVDLKPTDGYIVDSLGWADFKLGHYDEAARELERAVELKPGRPGRQRPSRRRLLARQPPHRGAFPVEPRARFRPGAGGPAADPGEDQERPAGCALGDPGGNDAEPRADEERRVSQPAGGPA